MPTNIVTADIIILTENFTHQRQFFRGGKRGQASLTIYQSTNKIIAVFIPNFVSYIKKSRLIKQEKFFVSLH